MSIGLALFSIMFAVFSMGAMGSVSPRVGNSRTLFLVLNLYLLFLYF